MADTPSEALAELLVGLCHSPEDELILEQLCDAVEEFGDDIIVFQDGWECEYEPGREFPKHADTPTSFHAISAVVAAIWWDGGGPEVGYALEEDGSPSADDWLFGELKEDEPEEFGAIEAAGKVVACFMGGQNGLFFDPTRKLSNGEPAMAFISHEGGGWEPVESVNSLDYGQILLRMLADAMLETEYIPEIYF